MKAAGLFGPHTISPWSPAGPGLSDPKGPGQPGEEKPIPGVDTAGAALLKGRPLARQLLEKAPEHQRQQFSKASRNASPDAFNILAGILQKYTDARLTESEGIASASTKRAGKIAHLQKVWQEAKVFLESHADISNPGKQTASLRMYWGDLKPAIQEVKDAMVALKGQVADADNALGGSDAAWLDYVFPGRQMGSNQRKVSYNDIRTADAIVLSFCEEIQAAVESDNHKFKNFMTEMTSAQQEHKGLLREIAALSKR